MGIKKLSKLFCLIMFVMFSAQAREKISINVENTPAAQVFSLLASARQLNLVVDPAIEQLLTLQLTDVEWQDALDIVQYLAKVEIVEYANMLLVREAMAKNEENEQALLNPRKQKVDLIQRTFPLKFIEAAELEKQLRNLPHKMIARPQQIYVDHTRQQIVVWDSEEALAQIEQWIVLHDQPQPQIEITAQMISISENNLRELGVSWFNETSGDNEVRPPNYQFMTSLGVTTPALLAKASIAKIDSHLLFLELSALEQENQLEIIAIPRLVTSQGRTASIKQGTEIPYQTVSGKNDNPVTNFKEAVLGMEVTPERVGRAYIRLRLRLNQDVPGKILQSEGRGPPSIDKQEITTEVVVMDGETLALGGIFQQQQHQGTTRVPWLGQVPFLGALFKKQAQDHQKRELVIFITPRILPVVDSL